MLHNSSVRLKTLSKHTCRQLYLSHGQITYLGWLPVCSFMTCEQVKTTYGSNPGQLWPHSARLILYSETRLHLPQLAVCRSIESPRSYAEPNRHLPANRMIQGEVSPTACGTSCHYCQSVCTHACAAQLKLVTQVAQFPQLYTGEAAQVTSVQLSRICQQAAATRQAYTCHQPGWLLPFMWAALHHTLTNSTARWRCKDTHN